MVDNPKQAAGDKKDPLALVPRVVVHAMARALGNGARKYGPWNWRAIPVETMTYAHATLRHLHAWVDGEDVDPDSGLPHLSHALASLAILVDGMEHGAKDTRPGKVPAPAIAQPSPCPKCKRPPTQHVGRAGAHFVRCDRCYYASGYHVAREDAIAAWEGFVTVYAST